MDNLTFLASIIKSLAWPVAAVILALLFKDQIKKLAPFVKRLKAGPVEAEFERDVRQLWESAPAQYKSSYAIPSDTASIGFLLNLAALHPRSAVLEAWVRLEAAARAALPQPTNPGAMTSYLPAARLAEALVQAGVIDQRQVTLYHELRRLRNEVAHAVASEPTQESVLSYIELASLLQSQLERHAK